MKEIDKAFHNHKVNGVHLRFPNGNTLSTIWGYGSYSDNYNMDEVSDIGKRFDTVRGSNTVEIMPDCPDRLFKKIQRKFGTTGSVMGRLTMNDWLWVVNQLAKTPKKLNKSNA